MWLDTVDVGFSRGTCWHREDGDVVTLDGQPYRWWEFESVVLADGTLLHYEYQILDDPMGSVFLCTIKIDVNGFNGRILWEKIFLMLLLPEMVLYIRDLWLIIQAVSQDWVIRIGFSTRISYAVKRAAIDGMIADINALHLLCKIMP